MVTSGPMQNVIQHIDQTDYKLLRKIKLTILAYNAVIIK